MSDAEAPKSSGAMGPVLFWNLFIFIGGVMLFDQLREQTHKNYRYEGIFNAANYFLVCLWTYAVVYSALILTKHGAFANKNRTYTGLQYVTYPLAGFIWLFVLGVVQPNVGRLSWITPSFANLNSMRIGWETSSDVKELYSKFARLPGLEDFGLTDVWTVINENEIDDVDRTEYRAALAGVIMLVIGIWGLTNTNAGPNLGMPIATAESTGRTQGIAGFTSVVTFVLGFVATFVIWSSDAGADPSHLFYEYVMVVAASSLIVGSTFLTGYFTGEKMYVELGLFMVGFFLISAPVKLFQVKAFAQLDLVRNSMASSAYTDSLGFPTDSILTAEIDRYAVAAVLNVLQGFFAIYSGISFLAMKRAEALPEASNADAATCTETLAMDGSGYGYRPATDAEKEAGSGDRVAQVGGKKHLIHLILICLSFVMVIAGLAVGWRIISESLDEVGEDMHETYRADAANFFLFTILIAWGCMAVQYFGNVLASLKPLWFVSVGIYLSVFFGFSNVGTHDRQLWMIDHSLAGINEVRALAQAEDDDFDMTKAFGVDHDIYEQAQASQMLVILGVWIAYLATMKLPFTGFCGGKNGHWSKTGEFSYSANFYVWFPTLLNVMFFVISLIVLSASDLSEPAIHNAAEAARLPADLFEERSNAGDFTVPCKGDNFNILMNELEFPCFSASVINGTNSPASHDFAYLINQERFTLNPQTSWVPTDRKYWEIFTLLAMSMCVACGSFGGVYQGCARSLRTSAFIAGFLIATPMYALTYDAMKQNPLTPNRSTNINSPYDEMRTDYGCDSNGDCIAYKVAMAFFFLQGLCAIYANSKASGILDDYLTGKTGVESEEDKGKELFKVYKAQTPEQQIAMYKTLEERGYLTVETAETAVDSPKDAVSSEV
jgi:hypothetical protein